MYYETATIKRREKINNRKLKNGKTKESKTEVIEVKGIGIKSKFTNNEEVYIIKKDDLKNLLEKEQHITEYEKTIRDLEEEIIFLNKQMDLKPIPTSTNNREQDLLYNLLLNNALEEAINLISSTYDTKIREATRNNIKEVETILKNIRYDVEKQNNKIKDLQNQTIEVITNLNTLVSNFNKSIQTTNRIKLLFGKDKLFLNLDTTQIKEVMTEINKINSVDIANYNLFLDKILSIPNFSVNMLEVKKELEEDLKKLKEEFKPDDNFNFIEVD